MELILIPGKPRECGPDEFEYEPTWLGLAQWERDQVHVRRKRFRIVPTTNQTERIIEWLAS